jgi:cardiolipin synthase
MGNHELDLATDDEGFAREMEEAYLADLAGSTEIVLGARRRRRRRARPLADRIPAHGERRASSGLAAAGALRLGNTVGAALGGHRVLAATDVRVVAVAALTVFALAMGVLLFPRVVAFPIGVVGIWIAIALAMKAIRLRSASPPRRAAPPAALPRDDAAPRPADPLSAAEPRE